MIIPVLYGYVPMMISPYASANSEAHLFLIDPLIFDDGRYEVCQDEESVSLFLMLSKQSWKKVTKTREKRIDFESKVQYLFHVSVHQLLPAIQQLHHANHFLAVVPFDDMRDVRA